MSWSCYENNHGKFIGICLVVYNDDFLIEIVSSCSPPLSPSNGYIIPYNAYDSVEGATITFSCQNSCTCQGGLLDQSSLELHTAVCTSDGDWEPNPADFCSSEGHCLAQCNVL